MSNLNLTDLASLIKTAEAAATSMHEQSIPSSSSIPFTPAPSPISPTSTSSTPTSSTPISSSTDPSNPSTISSSPVQMPTPEQLKQAMANIDINSVLNKMTSDPEQTKKVMAETMNKMTPEMIEQAKKLAQGGQAERIMKEMQKRGMNPHQMKAEMEQQRKALRNLAVKSMGPVKKALIITLNRQLKSRTIPTDNVQASVVSILHCAEPAEVSCSRLALGVWSGKNIKVWYDASLKGKNKRASKLTGFPVAGDILIHSDDGDLSEEEFLEIEKQLE